jgi:phosphoglycolate phosphatase (TIGR01487 family)
VPIRAVAVDIDGTVTDYRRYLDFRGVKALRGIEARGIPVIAATGNVPPVTKAFSNFVGLSGALVCENGGAVFSNDMSRSKLLASRKKPDRAVRHLRKVGLRPRFIWSDPWRLSEVALNLEIGEEPVRKALEGWGLDVVATKFAVHIMEPGLDKVKGLRVALGFMPGRIKLDQVLAIGDSNNDVLMLAGCKNSGCVGNGSESAKAAARFVARRNHGSGVAEILEHYGLA